MELPDTKISERAAAKINLALHVVGQRDDGYHLLESLVVFTELGDQLHCGEAGTAGLSIAGPFAGELASNASNLILRAAEHIAEADKSHADQINRLSFHLEKSLPIASGIGGGSADAAAAIRAIARFAPEIRDTVDLDEIAKSLGADVFMCLRSQSAIVSGIGDELQPLSLPQLHLLLVNPGVSIATPEVFSALVDKNNSGLQEVTELKTVDDVVHCLSKTRNDLVRPAATLEPVIEQVLAELASLDGCLFSQMSGSGATCFAIFRDLQDCKTAEQVISSKHGDWWVKATRTMNGTAT